jgi:hypothetical protein
MDTVELTRADVLSWKVPTFQRPLRVNLKVLALADKIREEGVMPGVITLGKIDSEPHHIYIVDGQHRAKAFEISEMPSVLTDIRTVTFPTAVAMAEEFVSLNSSLVKMRPDDVLRGLEEFTPALQRIRKGCDFVGYTHIRKGDERSPVVSMSALIRAWEASRGDSPAYQTNSSAQAILQEWTDLDIDELIVFMSCARSAWGADPEYYRLWGTLNLTMCMWLWRKLVLEKDRGTKRYVVLDPQEFKRGLVRLTSEPEYISWLSGKRLSEFDRSPGYTRVRKAFIQALSPEGGKKILLPQPDWWKAA